MGSLVRKGNMAEQDSKNPKMKILEVIDWFPPGHHAGDSILARAFCNELHVMGHEVLVLTKKKAIRASHIDVEGEWKKYPYEVIRVKGNGEAIKPVSDTFEVAHAHQVTSLDIIDEVKLPADIPIIYHCHIDYLPLMDVEVDLGFDVPEYLAMQEKMLKRAAGIICHSKEVKASLASQGYPEDQIDIIDPIIDMGQKRKKKPGGSKELVVAIGGRMEDELKGFPVSIRVIKAVKEMTDNIVRLMVIGTYLDEQKAEAEKMLGDSVEFVGWVTSREGLQKQFSRADVFLSLSKSETFGLMILEAMSMGAVPVCTSVGEVAEKIEAYGAGVVLKADAEDDEAILEETADVLSGLALDRVLLNDHFEQGEVLSALYEPRHVTRELEKLLRKYMGG